MPEGVKKVKRVAFTDETVPIESPLYSGYRPVHYMQFSRLPKIGGRTKVRPPASNDPKDWIPVHCVDINDVGTNFIYIVERIETP